MVNKLYFTKDAQGNIYAYSFHCDGCGCGHAFYVAKAKDKDGNDPSPNWNHPIWQFNGDVNNPTFSPSLLYRGQVYPSGKEFPTDEEHARMMAGEKLEMKPKICHTFVRNGQIQYLSDCTHHLAGQTVNMPDIT